MTKLQELAGQLAGMYKARKSLQIDVDHVAANIEARRLMLTPAEGWPGKNEEQRSIARDKAFAADEELITLRQELGAKRDELAVREGEIEALQAVASAERWAVREKLVDALAARQVETSEDPQAEVPEWSDVEDEEAWLAAERTLAEYAPALPETPEALPWAAGV